MITLLIATLVCFIGAIIFFVLGSIVTVLLPVIFIVASLILIDWIVIKMVLKKKKKD